MDVNGRIRVGVVGAGFGASFYFHLHPNSRVEAVAATLPQERARLQTTYGCEKAYRSLTELLKDPCVDAVALFTPAPLHAQHSVEALQAGKHVLCAVPVGLSIRECAMVKKAVQQTGLTYMMAETSAYRQDTISVKEFYRGGQFGNLIAAEAEYHHPGLEDYFFDAAGKPTWRHGLPPMLYATHCTAFLSGVTGEQLASVSCIGWGDDSELLKGNPYGNSFWNQTALFKSELGTAFKVNISWRGALLPTERCEWHGDKMSFYSKDPRGLDAVIVKKAEAIGTDDAGFLIHQPTAERYEQVLWWHTDMLPEPLRVDSGHYGAHTFITHEFVDSLISGRAPEVDIAASIAYTLPGIVAHESALKNGEQLSVPTFESL
ncbi:MAG TPA: Gfo/Idh/MocA family oxidoreductase [Parapedobacter sp.]|uniref:Gfo/Idh/MocA family protein n=1 Tax=Parapedobacter sp. TaxID=1958893 RepID=UPI002BB5E18E|nr:Gfo/Idh/MocA family oxidoreductase [Parapedobacter sp.]HWK57104.1 Gfo/Idh/MocA family oxidoreductase [Parapedobacter sp.]